MTITANEILRQAYQKKNKFSAQKVKADGMTFDSKKEYARYCDLKLLERAGQISDLEHHVTFTLRVEDTIICKYEADFSYIETGVWIVEEVKSDATLTDLSRVKLALFRVLFPSATLRLYGLKKKKLKSAVKTF